MRKRFTGRLTYANVVATIALIVALGAGGPVIAKPIGRTAADIASSVRKALRLAKSADRRSKLALSRATKGEKGDPGERGEPGPATGPAGGALAGVYPNPLLAPDVVGPKHLVDEAVGPDKIEPEAVGAGAIEDESITRTEIADDTLRGAQIQESTLVGFDATAFDANASKDLKTGDDFDFIVKNGLLFEHNCYGLLPAIGFEVVAENLTEASRTVFTTTVTDGEPPDLDRVEIPPNGKVTIADAAADNTPGLLRLISIYNPSPEFETRLISIRTHTGVAGMHCRVDTFRTTGSG